MTHGSPPLFGLVLSGGRSTRMGRDKATLAYAGRSQLERAMTLLAPRVARCFVSVRADQRDEPTRRAYPQIVDRLQDAGPIAGILAAFDAHPDAAWLVLACDLPRLDGATLDHLIAHRAVNATATAYRSAHDALPEPLCAIYEPTARALLDAHLASGRQCPRKFLINANTALLDQASPQALDNVNTPADLAALDAPDAQSSHASTTPRPLRVRYFALLREQAGRSEEVLETGARTPRELYAELRARHPFTLAPEMLRVAVNDEFGEWTQPLAANDVVVFIPPVAGG